MAVTGTMAETYLDGEIVKKLTLDWVSAGRGNVIDHWTTKKLTGNIDRVVFIPDSGGTQPLNLYDVTITDDLDFDVLLGTGANLSNAAAVERVPVATDGTNYSGRYLVDSILELAVSGAGANKGGTIILYWRI